MEFSKDYIYLRQWFWIAFFIFSALLADPFLIYAQTDEEEMSSLLLNNVVRIIVNKKLDGFGFIVSEHEKKLYIVTADHLVSNSQPIEIEYYGKPDKRYQAILLKVIPQYKMALLEAGFPDDLKWIRDSLEHEGVIKRGTQVGFIGRDQKWYVPTIPGVINNVDSNHIISVDRLDITPGTSGAPLISGNGIIGMVFSDQLGNMTKAISIYIIKRAFEQWKLPWDLMLGPPSGELCITAGFSVKDTIEVSRRGTIIISKKYKGEEYLERCFKLRAGIYTIRMSSSLKTFPVPWGSWVSCNTGNARILPGEKTTITISCGSKL